MKDDRLYLIRIQEAIERIEDILKTGKRLSLQTIKLRMQSSAICILWLNPLNGSQVN